MHMPVQMGKAPVGNHAEPPRGIGVVGAAILRNPPERTNRPGHRRPHQSFFITSAFRSLGISSMAYRSAVRGISLLFCINGAAGRPGRSGVLLPADGQADHRLATRRLSSCPGVRGDRRHKSRAPRGGEDTRL